MGKLATCRHDSRAQALREEELVHLVLRDLGCCLGLPGRDGLLARRIQRLHRTPDGVHAVSEHVADEQVGDRSLQMREGANELAEAEAVVVLADQATHAVYT